MTLEDLLKYKKNYLFSFRVGNKHHQLISNSYIEDIDGIYYFFDIYGNNDKTLQLNKNTSVVSSHGRHELIGLQLNPEPMYLYFFQAV